MVAVDGKRGAAAEARAVDQHVLHHALHVVAGLHERDALDPVDGVDLGVARIAELRDPLLHAAAAGIVGRERQDVAAVVVLHHAAELGGADLQVIGNVVLEPLHVIAAAEALTGIPSRLGRDLHQAHRLGGRPVGRIEAALLADDGIEHRVVDAGPDRRIARHADGRECVIVERQAACERGLAELQHAARILALLGELAQRGEGADVVGGIANARHQRNDQAALVERVEDLERAHQLEPLRLAALVRRRRWRRECQLVEAEPHPRQLPVIGGRKARRRLELGARLERPVGGFRRAGEPVVGARERRRMVADVLDAREIGRRGRGVVEIAQRDPARHEQALDPGILLGRLGGVRDHKISRAGIAGIEQPARHDAPLDPPILAVMDLRQVAGCSQDLLRGLGDLVGAAQHLHLDQDVAGVLARLGRHGVEQLLGIAALAVDRDARLCNREVGAAETARGPQRRLVVVGAQPPFQARLMIGARQEVRVALEHLFLGVGGERIVAPRLAHERGRAVAVALREQRARQHQAANAGLRRHFLEEAYHLRRLGVLDPEHRFGAAAEHPDARPIRVGGDKGEVAFAANAVVVAAQDEPLDELARARLRDAGGDLGRLGGVVLADGLDRALHQRQVALGGLDRRPGRERKLRRCALRLFGGL